MSNVGLIKPDLIPLFNSFEKWIRKYGLAFTLIVLYQGVFGGIAMGSPPQRLEALSEHPMFKFMSLFAIALTATQDVETSIVASLVFITFLHLIKTPEERKTSGFPY
jgi:hypothetical protein